MEALIRWFRAILMLPKQASTFAYKVDALHEVVIGSALLVGALIFGTMIVAFIRFRRTEPMPLVKPRRSSIPVEIALWTVPLAIFVVWFFVGYHQYVWADTPPPDAMDIYVSAKQWMWKFTYPDGPNSLNVLRVPAGRPVRLLLTSRDVIHSFFVPAFRLKKDAVPDRYTQLWFQATEPGEYPIYCAEYCGLKHAFMWGRVVVMRPRDFAEWMTSQQKGRTRLADADPSATEADDMAHGLAAQGRRIAVAQGCTRCHSEDGTQDEGPTWLDLYRRTVTLQDGSTVLADEAYLTESMMSPDEKLVQGFKPVMPSYRGRLSAADAAALVEFIKSLTSSPREEPVAAPGEPEKQPGEVEGRPEGQEDGR